MQLRTAVTHLPVFDAARLQQEMFLFTDWLVKTYLKISLSTQQEQQLMQCFLALTEQALSQPQCFVHRDYHSRNLMVIPENGPGLLDFQDAVLGPITYDLVSLLRDCYIAWPREHVQRWGEYYYNKAKNQGLFSSVTQAQFWQWFDWMGIQRHLKASGIFARLYCRDGKSGYLADIPRTLGYIVDVSIAYPDLAPLRTFIQEEVLPRHQEALSCMP